MPRGLFAFRSLFPVPGLSGHPFAIFDFAALLRSTEFGNDLKTQK